MGSGPEELTSAAGCQPAGPRRRVGNLPHGLAAAAVLALLLTAGCSVLDPFVAGGDAPPGGAVYQVVATWKNEVAFAPDPSHAGAPTPGLAGRLYLFGPQIDFPLQGDGNVVVDLYDETSGKSVLLEEWRFDRDTLQKLLRKDMIGWGYTLFLPWGTYKPDVKQVRLKLCYQPPGGSPLYADNPVMTLNAAGAPSSPAGDQAPAAAAPRPPAATLPAQAAAATPAPLQVTRFPIMR
jgi:hypothetical protein